jgi:cytochrome c biogenesis protein CcmG/thiol:disulfide interchange protein DsbE
LIGGLAIIVLGVALSLSMGRPSPSAVVVDGSPLLGQPAPEISLSTVDGVPVSLSALRGRPVIVNFWASWCVPCRDEFPLLVEAYERYSGQGLEILGVIHDDGPQTAAAFARSYGATWPLLQDPDDAAWRVYRGALVPITYYIDRAGIIRAISYGPPPSGYLDQEIQKIL